MKYDASFEWLDSFSFNDMTSSVTVHNNCILELNEAISFGGPRHTFADAANWVGDGANDKASVTPDAETGCGSPRGTRVAAAAVSAPWTGLHPVLRTPDCKPGRRMAREFPSIWFERYADDRVLHRVTERQARQVLAALMNRMAEAGLHLLAPHRRISTPWAAGA
ncbi:hypothetical protein [Streptomyces yaizuensis]|uniref:Reverse transcriptase domain-containing protein n=1 Tax=Streptomyces yaizuensis TaxID=2989713 RepID=A0ABQ5NY90_9ACTN|nr:hypothetical protein [Streptomyces sp. YSPA8]GLF95123.1 hypothetical protein SYYSPA8_12520 [Streptomyces sp. YSPA8]